MEGSKMYENRWGKKQSSPAKSYTCNSSWTHQAVRELSCSQHLACAIWMSLLYNRVWSELASFLPGSEWTESDWKQPRIQPPAPVLSKSSRNSQLWFRGQSQFRITPINWGRSLLIGPAVTRGGPTGNFFLLSLCRCQLGTTGSVWFRVARGIRCVHSLVFAVQVCFLSSSLITRTLGQSFHRTVLIYGKSGSRVPFNNPVGCQMLRRTFLVWVFIFITACV